MWIFQGRYGCPQSGRRQQDPSFSFRDENHCDVLADFAPLRVHSESNYGHFRFLLR